MEKSKTPNDTQDGTNQHFYERALASHTDRMGSVVQRDRRQTLAIVCLSVAFILSSLTTVYAVVILKTRPVELVKINVGGGSLESGASRQVAGAASGSTERDRQVLEQTLGNYIRNLKTVSGDADLMIANITQAQVMSSAAVVTYVRNYFQTDTHGPYSPFELAAKYRVSTDLRTIQRITDTTYRVDWIETFKDANTGLVAKTERWTSTVTFKLLGASELPPKMNFIDNPLALMVVGLEWSKDQ